MGNLPASQFCCEPKNILKILHFLKVYDESLFAYMNRQFCTIKGTKAATTFRVLYQELKKKNSFT